MLLKDELTVGSDAFVTVRLTPRGDLCMEVYALLTPSRGQLESRRLFRLEDHNNNFAGLYQHTKNALAKVCGSIDYRADLRKRFPPEEGSGTQIYHKMCAAGYNPEFCESFWHVLNTPQG